MPQAASQGTDALLQWEEPCEPLATATTGAG